MRGTRLPARARMAAVSLCAVGAAVVAANVLAAAGGPGAYLTGPVPHLPVAFAAAVAVSLRGLLVDGDRAAWLLIGAGVAAWALGDLASLLFAHSETSFGSDEALWLLSYPLLIAGLLAYGRPRLRGGERGAVLDGLLAAFAIGALAAVSVGPAIAEGAAGPLVASIGIAVGDVALVSVALALLAVIGPGGLPARSLVLLWLAGMAIALMLADAVWLLDGAGIASGHLASALWAASALCAVLAAAGAGEDLAPKGGQLRLLVRTLLSSGAIALLVVDHFTRLPTSAVVLAGLALSVTVVRLWLELREHRVRSAAMEHKAETDVLTGLGNRGRLLADLADALETRRPTVLVMLDLDGFKAYNDAFGHAAGDHLLRRLAGRLAALGEPSYRLGGDEFCVLAPAGGWGDARRRLGESVDAMTESGDGFSITASAGLVMLPREASDPSGALALADRRMYAAKNGRRFTGGRLARDLLLRMIAEQQPALVPHVRDRARLAGQVAERLGLTSEEVARVSCAAELRDVGKVAVPDSILNKPGPLTPDERALVERHPLVAERIMAAVPGMSEVAALVRSSGERWNGSGYPDGLAGEEIPLGSRIIAACDAFGALTTGRPWRDAMPVEEALAELERERGGRFAPDVVDAVRDLVRSKAGERPAELKESGPAVAERSLV